MKYNPVHTHVCACAALFAARIDGAKSRFIDLVVTIDGHHALWINKCTAKFTVTVSQVFYT